MQAFTLEEFFTQYPRSLHTENPKYNSDNAPLNNYSDDFGEVSIKAKSAANWVCQKCSIDLSSEKKFLHTHHMDGAKFDNSRDNLKVLCYGCHADEPGHQHMKRHPDFALFSGSGRGSGEYRCDDLACGSFDQAIMAGERVFAVRIIVALALALMLGSCALLKSVHQEDLQSWVGRQSVIWTSTRSFSRCKWCAPGRQTAPKYATM